VTGARNMTVPPTTRLFTDDTPLLDVRAPVEFGRGAFPSAHNIPILDDNEREQVGICYKEQGPEAAVELGHQLVSGRVKAERVEAWLALLRHHPDLHLYCFRGGQRSTIAEQWLREAGADIPRIEGGYKAMRRLLLEVFEHLPALVVVAGKTGVGKTEFLEQLPADAVVDLEAHANHRGSAFGKRLTPQPAQIDFENRVAIDFLKSGDRVFVEDESRMIGVSHVPPLLQEAMQAAPVIVIEDTLERRAERIFGEYVVEAQQELACVHDDPAAALHARLQASLDSIKKRLGVQRHAEISADLAAAFESGEPAGHRAWIEKLLVNYYDPMYEYQLERKAERITARGTAPELIEQASTMLHSREQADQQK